MDKFVEIEFLWLSVYDQSELLDYANCIIWSKKLKRERAEKWPKSGKVFPFEKYKNLI